MKHDALHVLKNTIVIAGMLLRHVIFLFDFKLATFFKKKF